jgi:hypothetical protein
MRGFLRFSKARTLADLSLDAARQYIAHRQEAGLSDNSVHARSSAVARWSATVTRAGSDDYLLG